MAGVKEVAWEDQGGSSEESGGRVVQMRLDREAEEPSRMVHMGCTRSNSTVLLMPKKKLHKSNKDLIMGHGMHGKDFRFIPSVINCY